MKVNTLGVQFSYDSSGNVNGLVGPSGGGIDLTRKALGKLCLFGDSLTLGGSTHIPLAGAKSLPLWTSTIDTTNLGGGTWLLTARPFFAATGNGVIRTDGAGSLQWSTDAGASYGPLVSVSLGGYYILQNGDASVSCLVLVRGSTTAPAAAGTGVVTKTGLCHFYDNTSHAFTDFLAGALGGTFTSIERWAASGSYEVDVRRFIDQCLAQTNAESLEAAIYLSGTNDAPATAANANILITRKQANISALAANFRRVYVGAIFPYPGVSATINQFLQRVNSAIELYCASFQNVRIVSSWDYLSAPDALAVTALTGAFHSDNLHLAPYGAWCAARPFVSAIQADYPANLSLPSMSGVWDATVGAGPWNTNPTLRGTGGTVTAGKGITGTMPDVWTGSRNAATQLCTTSFTAATDGKLSWFTLAVSNGDGADYHTVAQTISVPAGIAVGDKFRLVCELCLFAMTGNGLKVLTAFAAANSNLQLNYLLVHDTSTRNIATFNSENPVLNLVGNPQILQAGVTTFTLTLRVGAATGGATGSVGFRNFAIEKA